MSSDALLVQLQGSLCTIALNRPERRNALDETLIEALTNALHQAAAMPEVRIVALRGIGSTFCAGADLAAMARAADAPLEENLQDARKLQQLFYALDTLPCITVALAQGAAIGGGAGLLAACDVAIASPETFFAFSEVRLGLLPAVISPYVVRKIGMGTARTLFVTGKRFQADAALRMGLIQHIAQNLDSALDDEVKNALKVSPQAVKAVKELMRMLPSFSAEETAEATAQAIARARASEEGLEGVRAFLQGRSPSYFREETP